MWLLDDPGAFFWPLWSIVFWGVGLAFHYWSVHDKDGESWIPR
ncbi:2TM domain-containing protein [Herbidospora sp. RD11066]